MALAAIIPVADMQSANDALEASGHGPRNFSVALWASSIGPEYAGLHVDGVPGIEDQIKALPNVTTSEIAGRPVDRFRDCVAKAGCEWGKDFPILEGVVSPGNYQVQEGEETEYWRVIQQFDRDVFSDPLDTYPALVRRIRVPGEVRPWVQPIDQFDAYYLVNPFTGEPDRVMHNGSTWSVSQADGSGVNVWEPGVFGWTEEV